MDNVVDLVEKFGESNCAIIIFGEFYFQNGYSEYSMILEFIRLEDVILLLDFYGIVQNKSCNQSDEW